MQTQAKASKGKQMLANTRKTRDMHPNMRKCIKKYFKTRDSVSKLEKVGKHLTEKVKS
jgi:hypothetical protein